jgi:hypothetical protein
LEASPDEWCAELVAVFREVRRILKPQATLWIEVGDSYGSSGGDTKSGFNDRYFGTSNGLGKQGDARGLVTSVRAHPTKPKDLIGAPWLLAFALRADGWYLRQCIIWQKPNPMPESVRDRCTTAHSYLFLLSKQPRYFFDTEAIAEPAEWARWGDQTVPKYEGTETASGWMQPKTKAELAPIARRKPLIPEQTKHGVGSQGLGSSTFGQYPENGRKNARSVWSIPTEGFSARALGGGATRITSPDCPVHGDRAAPAPTVADGERADARASRIEYSGDRPAQVPLDDCAPIERPHAPDSAPDSSGSPDLGSARVASSRSSENHRTDRAPATNPACTPSAETLGRIGDRSASPGSVAATDLDSPESRTSAAYDVHEPDTGVVQTADRTARRCTCEVRIPDHFATWPQALVERIIKAGCPEWVCVTCGKPRERIVETTGEWRTQHDRVGKHDGTIYRTNPGGGISGPNTSRQRTEIGWSDCGCGAGFTPGVCLDPFMGSGTTALVARRLGRRSVGVELNAEYAAMAAARTGQLSLLAEAQS